ncbi:MAG: peptidylprolyl isomerase [Planctomycetaceae bacterium]
MKRFFLRRRHRRRPQARHFAAGAVECFEDRRMLAATVIAELPDVLLSATSASSTLQLAEFFDDPAITGSTVEVGTPLGNIFIETYDRVTPLTTTNFLNLVDAGRYQDMFFHRSVNGFVLQGGGFTFPSTGTSTGTVASNGTVVNEFSNWFDPELGGLAEGTELNTRGTIAMAKLGGDPDSATTQWFISVADNSAILDPQNGGFTVFAHVLFDGMSVVDQLMALEVVNAGGVFAELPVINLSSGATSILRENLLLTTSARVQELTYSVTSVSKPELLTAAIVDGQLTVTALNPAAATGQTVQVTVTATDLQGNQVSSVADIYIGVTGPVVVTGPVNVTGVRPTITWTAASGAESYDLWISKMEDQNPAVVETAGVIRQNAITATSFTASSDLSTGIYRAWVRTRNGSTTGAWSTPFDFSVGLTTPGIVSNVTVSAVSGSATQAVIQWEAQTSASGYDVWINKVGQGTLQKTEWVSGTSFEFSVEPGAAYRVWVRGRNAGSVGDWSSGVLYTGSVAAPGPVIVRPIGTGGITTDARPVIAWSSSPTATTYDIWIAPAGSSQAAIRTTSATTSFQPDSDLAEGQYRVWVRAQNAGGNSAWSAPVTFGVRAGGPLQLTGPTGTNIPIRPTLTWSQGFAGSTYQLWVNQLSTGQRVIFETGLSGTSFTATADLAVGSYRAWVREVPASGPASVWSAAFGFVVGSAPDIPSLSTSVASGIPTFTWTTVSGAVRYELWVSLDGTGRVLLESQLTSLTFAATGLQAGSYRAWLRAYDANNAVGGWSSVSLFTIT